MCFVMEAKGKAHGTNRSPRRPRSTARKKHFEAQALGPGFRHGVEVERHYVHCSRAS